MRYYRIGIFYETKNNKDKLFSNKKIGFTTTRDLSDSLFTFAFGIYDDISSRRFFYREIEKYNLMNPNKKLIYLEKKI